MRISMCSEPTTRVTEAQSGASDGQPQADVDGQEEDGHKKMTVVQQVSPRNSDLRHRKLTQAPAGIWRLAESKARFPGACLFVHRGKDCQTRKPYLRPRAVGPWSHKPRSWRHSASSPDPHNARINQGRLCLGSQRLESLSCVSSGR